MAKIELTVQDMENVKTSGLLRCLSNNRNNATEIAPKFCFTDLTIQEFFSARYFINKKEKQIIEKGQFSKLVAQFVDEFSQKAPLARELFVVQLRCGSLLHEKRIESILKALKTRHSSVLKTGCPSEMKMERRHGLVHDYMLQTCNAKGLEVPKTGTQNGVLRLNTSADMTCVCQELDIDIDKVTTSYLMDLRLKGISGDQVITAYLKQTARKILNLPSSAQRIHSIIPYHHHGQTAVVIYTYNAKPELFKKDWSKEFLGFPVFAVNLMYTYEVEPPVLPMCYPIFPQEKQKRYSKIKDKVTQKLAEKHSTLSSVSVDFRIKGNQLNEDELCLQIGVLTKGIIPLGEETISQEIDGVPVDVVECSATVCFRPWSEISFWPVKLGVGIGVEGENTSTGSLGAVVKHKESGELFFLSNAHVLCREGDSSLSIMQPSQQDYENMTSYASKHLEECKKKCDRLRARIEQNRSDGYDVQGLEDRLKIEDKLRCSEEELFKMALKSQCPRKIGTFSSRNEHFVKQNHDRRASSKAYGVDAAIALIERDEFEPEDMTKMYEWPDDLKDEDGNNVAKTTLNGNFKNEEEGQEALASHVVVFKCGRTTGVTKGMLLKEINVKLNGSRSNFASTSYEKDSAGVSLPEAYQPSHLKLNDDVWYNVLQIPTTTERKTGRRSFSVNGDSGAVVYDEKGTCVGLLFGRIDSQVFPFGGGLATPIHAVFDALNITLATPSDF
jgi:hypothetical protein